MGQGKLFPAFEYNTLDVVKVVDDDFTGLTLDTGDYTIADGGGSGAVSPTKTAGTVNGIIKLTTGTASNSTASSEIGTGLQMRGDLGAVVVACVSLSAITSVKVEIGFTDALADPGAVNVKATPTFQATDCALWVLDTTDNAYWEGVAANNGDTSPASTIEAAISPTADTYEWLMVELHEYDDSGNICAVKYRRFNAAGGQTFESEWQTVGPNSNVLLTPWIYVEARSSSTRVLSVDYFGAWQRRTT
jgi:hypothetical protein